jgi:hypothetical protein
MPAPNQCAGKLANQVTMPTTQTPDGVSILSAIWDNKVNKGRLTVVATSTLLNSTQNLQLYVQAFDQFNVPMAGDPQPMQLAFNGLCPTTNSPCWQYIASGTIVDPMHPDPAGNTNMPSNIFAPPTKITVYSSRGGQATTTNVTLVCSVINGQNTCF